VQKESLKKVLFEVSKDVLTKNSEIKNVKFS